MASMAKNMTKIVWFEDRRHHDHTLQLWGVGAQRAISCLQQNGRGAPARKRKRNSVGLFVRCVCGVVVFMFIRRRVTRKETRRIPDTPPPPRRALLVLVFCFLGVFHSSTCFRVDTYCSFFFLFSPLLLVLLLYGSFVSLKSQVKSSSYSPHKYKIAPLWYLVRVVCATG